MANRLKQHVIACKMAGTQMNCNICDKLRTRIFVFKYPTLGRLLFETSFAEKHDHVKLLRADCIGSITNAVRAWIEGKFKMNASTTKEVAEYVFKHAYIDELRCKIVLEDPQQIRTTAEFAYCVILRSEPWSIATHTLFPDRTHQRAIQLLYIGYRIAGGGILDVWRSHIMPYALEETIVPQFRDFQLYHRGIQYDP